MGHLEIETFQSDSKICIYVFNAYQPGHHDSFL